MNRLRLKTLILIAACCLSCILCALTLLPEHFYKAALPHQQAAERWNPDGDYAQVTLLLSDSASLMQDDIPQFRDRLTDKLTEASLEAEEGKRLWYDAYSAEASVTLERGFLKSAATAVGIGGDFFLIHSMRLLSGAYISESDLNRDMAVLDELTAWNLFGSYDCTGMDFKIGQKIYYVAGVVKRDEGSANELTMGELGRVYLQFEELGRDAPINCYEAVMPDLVKDFALTTLEDVQTAGLGEYLLIQNTDRFGLINLLENLKDFSLRAVRTDKITYPYWENAARVTVDRLSILLVLRVLLGGFPLICLMVWLIIRYRNRKWHVRDLLARLDRIIEGKRLRDYEKKLERSAVSDDSIDENIAGKNVELTGLTNKEDL